MIIHKWNKPQKINNKVFVMYSLKYIPCSDFWVLLILFTYLWTALAIFWRYGHLWSGMFFLQKQLDTFKIWIEKLSFEFGFQMTWFFFINDVICINFMHWNSWLISLCLIHLIVSENYKYLCYIRVAESNYRAA